MISLRFRIDSNHNCPALYIPEYTSFTANCVENELGLNGTFLSRNLFTIAYDYASSDGDSVLSSGIETYNNDVASLCNSAYSSSSASLLDSLQRISSVNSTLQVSATHRRSTVTLF